jgi:hypothetical protein
MQSVYSEAPAMSLRIIALIILAIAPCFLVNMGSQASSGLQPGFNEAILDVQKAEAAGATANETGDLVRSLNRALNLSEQSLQLTGPSSAAQRTQLLGQVNQILFTVDASARRLQIAASQRATKDRIVAYAAGAAVALIATFVYALCISFSRRYRVKRTLQMRIIPK